MIKRKISIFKRAHLAIKMFVVVVVIGLLLQCENNHSNNYFKHISDWLVFMQYYMYITYSIIFDWKNS